MYIGNDTNINSSHTVYMFHSLCNVYIQKCVNAAIHKQRISKSIPLLPYTSR